MIWTLAFWKGLGERSIKTFAATLAGLIAGDGLGLVDVDWGSALGVTSLATLVTVLIAIGNSEFVAGASKGDHSA